MKIAIIIEARMSSSRLPGKVLLKVKKKPLLKLMIERLQFVKLAKTVIVATTLNKKDDVIVNFCKKNKIKYFRGSENDVLLRVLQASKKFKVDLIVEITSDCPLIDPNIVDQTIAVYLINKKKVDYVTNALKYSYPNGMDVQVFKTNLLNKVSKLTNNKYDRENVTSYIYKNPNRFRVFEISSPPNLYWPELGLTLDTKDDFKLIKKIILILGKIKQFFSCLYIIDFLKKNLKITKINKNVVRKEKLPSFKWLSTH